MMAFRKTGLVLSLVAAGALGATAANAGGAGKSAGTTLMDADGKSIGQVSIKKEDDGLLVKTTVTGLKPGNRSEEHTSELQSLMRSSYAVFCLKKKKK